MKCYSIVIKDDKISEHGFYRLLESAKKHKVQFNIERFDAITHVNAKQILNDLDLSWNYPFEGYVIDVDTKLKKTAYATRIKEKRIACSLSHYFLWKKCIEHNTEVLILEHDAEIIKNIDFLISDTNYEILGINDPRGATRNAKTFHNIIQESELDFLPVPIIDKMDIPQGLAGNSSYIITPKAAIHLIDLCNKFGLWPNDAIMCQQLIPNMGVTKNYYTKIQGLQSTTSS